MKNAVIYQIPLCPFCQRVEILLSLKRTSLLSVLVDGTSPRPDAFLKLTGGSTQCPVLETGSLVLKESIVIMEYLDDKLAGPKVLRKKSSERAIERMLIRKESALVEAGYRLLMNQDKDIRTKLIEKLLECFSELNKFLLNYAKGTVFLFERFGFSEAVFSPFFLRFKAFLKYFEDFDLPNTPEYSRVITWMNACLDDDVCAGVSEEEIVKAYYDYALGFGNGLIPAGRTKSSFSLFPSWKFRPMPPKAKYEESASDKDLGLL